MIAPTTLPTWLDRVTLPLFPRWTLRRLRARAAADLLQRHFEAASSGRRTSGWKRPGSDANAASAAALGPARNAARDVVRNNAYAVSALTTIVDHVVGWGILGAPRKGAPGARAASARWDAWANTTACDADGRLDFAGIQKQVLRTVVESGEVLVRRRVRRPEDGLPIPLQLQVLEPDHLDTSRDGIVTANGGAIVQGIEFSPIGQRVAYWLFRTHPGAMGPGLSTTSDRIPASELLHVWQPGRPGQARGVTWLAPILLRLKDLDDYEDAALMKQKVAACLAVVMTDADGTAAPIGRRTEGDDSIDTLEPGSILTAPAGRTVSVVNPPAVSEHDAFTRTNLRAIASALGLTYEDLTGDYAGLPFSAARMSRIRHWARVEDWRWGMLVPQLCDPVWAWAMQAAAIVDAAVPPVVPPVEWTAPAMPMIEPDKEGLAYARNIRAGITTLSEAIRERGYDPERLLTEYAADLKLLDRLGLVLDSDARKMTQAGQLQGTAAATAPTPAPNGNSNGGNGNGAGDDDAVERVARRVLHLLGR